MSSEERTEQPTQHKLKEARKRGDVAISHDLASAVGFSALLLALWMLWSFFAKKIAHLFSLAFDAPRITKNDTEALNATLQMLSDMVWIVLPLMLAAVVTTTLVALLQTKGLWSAHPLKPNFERMNPGASLKRLFSSRQGVEVIKLVVKLVLLLAVSLTVLKLYLPALIVSVHGSTHAASAVSARALVMLFGAAAGMFLLLGLVDYAHQFYEHIKSNRMAKTEVKREYRDQEGDPHLRSELRALRRELTEAAPQRGVRQANVVVTNPTHFAVALFYQAAVVDLPVVVAKEQDADALAMRQQAQELNIPIVEYPPLARALFRDVAVGQSISENHVDAVAEVFRWLQTLPTNKNNNDAV